MSINPRIYYPIHAVGFAPNGTPTIAVYGVSGYRAAKGVQRVGFTTNFNLEQVYQLGQLSIYENIENIPNVEITVEKVIDGYALLEHLATATATSPTLAGRYNDNRCMVAVSYYPITLDYSSGVPLSTVVMSGCFVSAINWTIPVVGNMTEALTLVSNDKQWINGPTGVPWLTETQFSPTGTPVLPSGGVLRRENVVMASSFWPRNIPGIDVNGVNVSGSNGYAAHVQNVTIGVTLGREDLFELGHRSPYFRFAVFPAQVTTAIEVTASESGDATDADSEAQNLNDERIYVYLDQNIIIDAGTKNKLQTVSTQGGDTGGGNATLSYSYSTFNDLKITQPSRDPAGLS